MGAGFSNGEAIKKTPSGLPRRSFSFSNFLPGKIFPVQELSALWAVIR
jgi:hypothetical protein